MASTKKNTLRDIWNTKIRDTDFVHSFFVHEKTIYQKLFSQKTQKMSGRLSELAESFGVSNEVFFGFLLGIQSFVKQDFENLRHRDRVNIDIDLHELHEYLNQNPSYAHLLEFEVRSSTDKEQEEALDMSLIPIGMVRSKWRVDSIVNNIQANYGADYYQTLMYAAPHFGLQIVLFTYDDIDFEGNKVSGTIVHNGKVGKCVIDIPSVVDCKAIRKDALKKLDSLTYLTRHSLLTSKQKIYELLLEDGRFSDILIPTKIIESFDDIIAAADTEAVVIKAARGGKGKSVRSISRVHDGYNLIEGQSHSRLTYAELLEYFDKNIKGKNFVLQPFIDSTSINGEPFDIRISARRGEGGKFSFTPYVRIGNPKGIISNLAGGGYSLQADVFLRKNFDSDTQNEIKQQLNLLGEEFPEYFASLFDTEIFDVGLDLGITQKNGRFKLWLFEADTDIGGDGTLVHGLEQTVTHCQYYRHLANKLGLIKQKQTT